MGKNTQFILDKLNEVDSIKKADVNCKQFLMIRKRVAETDGRPKKSYIVSPNKYKNYFNDSSNKHLKIDWNKAKIFYINLNGRNKIQRTANEFGVSKTAVQNHLREWRMRGDFSA